MNKVSKIINTLNNTPGLHSCFLLDDYDKDNIKDLEEERNIGVFECLKRQFTLMVLHNSLFREPISNIVIKNNNFADHVCFPPIHFPEINAKDVVSSSPSTRIHSFLIERFHLHPSSEDASLLIGFDL
ncbi:MAG: hypothetical protein AABW49_02620 [Nanoarchaeota archaeon]